MERNIITKTDLLARAAEESTSRGLDVAPAGGSQRTADDYWAKLAKYVPIEIISAYLLIDGLIRSGASSDSAREWLMFGFLSAGVVATWFFARRVLGIVRRTQTVLSCVGFIIWVLATGGWFALQSWYAPWIGTVAVIVFGVLVQIVKIPPLPDPPAG